MREPIFSFRAGQLVAVLAALTILPASLMRAQVVTVPSTPQIGSSNPITAAPSVSRPSTEPCVVQLFNNLEFADFTPKVFSYTPPSNCPGPWAKVVFTADFTVTAGRQYDRTAAFYLGHASIYYGTTSEPRATLSPSWHLERDVTDLSAIFNSAQTGEANIGNFVGVSGGVTYNGIIYANAALEFYPASFRDPAPRTPDIVVPVNGSGGDAGTLNTTTDQITQTLNLPTNVENVYLDVIAQSQSNDEFWPFCVPSNEAASLLSCGNTAFRETEIWIDGKAAGVAPVYPWIFTGGIDPYLWEPIPGVQTLDFKPYRVDLTPFAGLLSDGNQHTVAVSVFNANSYFLATANLLVYTDHGSQHVTGGVLSNTLSAAPSPTVNENINFNSATNAYTGSIDTSSSRSFAITGYVNTSHGRVETTVNQTVNFVNNQQFNVTPTIDGQNAEQTTTVDSETTTHGGPLESKNEEHFSFPLTIDYNFVANPDGSADQVVSVNQQYLLNVKDHVNGSAVYTSSTSNQVQAQDTLVFNTNGTYGPSGAKTTQSYFFQNSKGDCYSRTLTAAANVLTAVTNGQGCKANH
jgi:hypothetical protein